MKPKEEGGVVDSRLNVYGVENLKVADVSPVTFLCNGILILFERCLLLLETYQRILIALLVLLERKQLSLLRKSLALKECNIKMNVPNG